MKHSITKRLILYFVAVLLLFALLTTGIYIWIYRRTVMAQAKQNLIDRGQRIAEFLTKGQAGLSRDLSANDPSFETNESKQLQGQGKGKQERRGLKGYRVGQNASLTMLNDIEIGDLWLIDKKSQTVLTAANKNIAFDQIPESIDSLLGQVFEGAAVYSEDFGAFFGTPSMTVGYPIRDGSGDVALAFFLHSSIKEATSGLMSAWQGLLLSLLVALVVVVLLSVVLSRRFIEPLKKLRLATEQLAEGDYRVRTGINIEDEIGQLSREIDVLAIKLEEADVEREQADQLRRKFLSEVSHELRTPVTVIRGSLEALRDGVVKEEDIPAYYETMSASAGSLDRLVNDLLDLTRLDNPEFTLDLEEVNLLDVAEDAVRQMRPIAAKKDITVDLNTSGGDYVMTGDYGRLRQMLTNILSNAVKFSPNGSRVVVDFYAGSLPSSGAFDPTNYHAIIRVQDEGVGMSEETIKHLFDRFYTTGETRIDSSGLGLAIAKSIADRHQIDIHVESREYQGTTVWLAFRCSRCL